MTINDIIYGVAKYFLWLYFRHWEGWELLIIALISVVLLSLIVHQHRKAAVNKVYANQFRERSPIIGLKLADSRSHAKSRVAKRDRPASLPKKDKKEKRTKGQLKNLNRQIQGLKVEISKHEQNEKRLEQQIAELTAAKEKLQEETVTNRRAAQPDSLRRKIAKNYKGEQYSARQIVGVPAASEQPRPEIAKSQKNEQQSSTRTGQLRALRKLSRRRVLESLQSDRTLHEKTEHFKTSKEVREEPLDVQKLKAIAELAKQIQGRRRRY